VSSIFRDGNTFNSANSEVLLDQLNMSLICRHGETCQILGQTLQGCQRVFKAPRLENSEERVEHFGICFLIMIKMNIFSNV
jgi:hypothetical protein